MSTAQLNCLIKLYIETTKELDSLKADYENSNVYRGILEGLKQEFNQGAIKTGTDYHTRRYIVDSLLGPESDAFNKKDSDSASKMFQPDTQIRISYLEKKLELIKQRLDADTISKIESCKVENLIKSAII